MRAGRDDKSNEQLLACGRGHVWSVVLPNHEDTIPRRQKGMNMSKITNQHPKVGYGKLAVNIETSLIQTSYPPTHPLPAPSPVADRWKYERPKKNPKPRTRPKKKTRESTPIIPQFAKKHAPTTTTNWYHRLRTSLISPLPSNAFLTRRESIDSDPRKTCSKEKQ